MKKEPLLIFEALALFQTVVNQSKKELFDDENLTPKIRDMFLQWSKNKVKYFSVEKKYKRISEKRAKFEESQEKRKSDPTYPLATKPKARERSFLNRYEKEYNPKDIVKIDLGFNVGNEYGGEHFGIVFKKSSPRQNTVYVIPLTSVEPDDTLHFSEYEIGVIKALNLDPRKPDVISAAKMKSALEVSKFRLLDAGQVFGQIDNHQWEELRREFFHFMFQEEYQELNQYKVKEEQEKQ